MTRKEAIDLIIGVWEERDAEYCCSDVERAVSRKEMFEALEALDVTKEETK